MTESEWGPRARRAFLAGLDSDQAASDPDIFSRVAAAERVLGACESDWSDANDALRAARADAPDADLAADRELSPDARHRLVALYQAMEHETRADAAYCRARAKLDGLLAVLDDLSRPDLGRPPGREKVEAQR
jgi:hypothetical protein